MAREQGSQKVETDNFKKARVKAWAQPCNTRAAKKQGTHKTTEAKQAAVAKLQAKKKEQGKVYRKDPDTGKWMWMPPLPTPPPKNWILKSQGTGTFLGPICSHSMSSPPSP
jgi:hypothetical protein